MILSRDYLSYITQLNIDYLSKLDYIDLKNLCASGSQFTTICTDNIILRQIISNRNVDINIVPNFNIAETLNDIYGKLQKLITLNFPLEILPIWVNNELFNDVKLREFADMFIEQLIYDIFNTYDDGTYNLGDSVELNKSSIAYPLYSKDVNEERLYYASLDVLSAIPLTDLFKEYINPVVIQSLKEYEPDQNYWDNYRKLKQALQDVLLIIET